MCALAIVLGKACGGCNARRAAGFGGCSGGLNESRRSIARPWATVDSVEKGSAGCARIRMPLVYARHAPLVLIRIG